MTELRGKNAFVTGGTRGIGAAIAQKMAEEGANVAFTYYKSQDEAQAIVQEIEAKGVKGLAIPADAMRAENVVQAIQKAVSVFGAIDILINSAGIFELKSITESTLEDYERTESVNVKAVFAATMEAVKSMPGGGRIITIGSVNADLMPFPGCSLYAMSKAAVKMMTQSWARDLGDRKITANVIQPGPINTDMNPADGPFGEALTAMTAIKRYGKSEEVAELAAFLASPKASNITGSAINIDGGMTI
ncbi:Cyclic-di-GMP-binding biofilm dispersal mediator protein [Hyella patelloides LEGE 07179]|uniref:Cyclic-di-GMP-binding biofilm dispersal mediator protein n=1 Tax=Hyella patelloides LEGE 07179 TaxID=945734 RepID=A0A563VSW5_9CYAN|nr:3-oxoacyl-ACP reductase family protein [Hyella patelloides]VEP14515.1 Cyclic-di-GMP-binding biofilm dispersal mediator protein [Hyella patelloides LEGE 07179]